jgi:Flp pilus assembly protein TadD
MPPKSALIVVALGLVVAIGFFAWQRARAPVDWTPRDERTATNESVPEVAGKTIPGRKVIFVGLDGADWTLLDQYMAKGTMPVLAGLVGEGTRGTLTTIHPPLSPLIWTTMMTGVSPLEHRVLDFLRVNRGSRQREPITSDERKVPAIWNMATYAGKRVGALGMWATYPAEPVNGLLVSDRLFTFLYGEKSPPPGIVFPPGQEAWAREGLTRAEQSVAFPALKAYLPWLTEQDYQKAAASTDPFSHPVSALRRILVETQVYDGLARDWAIREKPDLLIVYVQGTDSIGHVFAPFAPPRQPSISAEDYEKYNGVPERYFASIDRLLGEYRKLAEQTGSVLMLASDHGFTWTEGRPTRLSSFANATAARWHTNRGMYLLWGPGIERSTDPAREGSVQQVCSTLMALLGLPAAKEVMGPPLPGADRPSAQQADYKAHYIPVTPIATSASQASAKMDEEALARLRALGYIGATEGQGKAVGTRTAGSFNNEGLLLKQQGKETEAIEAFDTALSVDPSLAAALWNLSDILFARNDLDKSDALLVRAFASGLPEGTKFLIGRAIGYQRSGRIDRSIRLLNQAAAAKPDEPEIWLFRGRYRVEQGDCAGAVGDFRQATSLAPTNAGAFASLGLAEVCAGDRASARASFERSLQLDPNQPNVREYLRGGRP